MSTINGKVDAISAATNFGQILENVEIESSFENDQQVVLVYDMTVKSIGTFRACAFMKFTDDLISTIELFYDARLFAKS